jgi:uncharacterized lipoprotein YmbA
MKRYIYITICLVLTACATPQRNQHNILIDGNVPEHIARLV